MTTTYRVEPDHGHPTEMRRLKDARRIAEMLYDKRGKSSTIWKIDNGWETIVEFVPGYQS